MWNQEQVVSNCLGFSLDFLNWLALTKYPIFCKGLIWNQELASSHCVRDLTFVNFVYMRGGMCVRDEAVWCVLIVCVGPRDSVIGCVLHVNAHGSLGVYIWRRSARQECGGAVRESVYVERLEFVGVESESCWSDWSRVGVESSNSCWDRGGIGIEWAREEGRR